MVSDGSGLGDRDDALAALRAQGELISGLARVPVEPKLILAADTAGLAAGIRALPPDLEAVLLVDVEPSRAAAVQRELRASGGRPLMTQPDAAAIALAAATLSALTDTGLRLLTSKVILAGTDDLPILTALLMAAGVGDITTWTPSDAPVFPLHNILFGANAVIDLVGGLPSDEAGRRSGIAVIRSSDATSAPYAAAGLLRAAVNTPGLSFDIEIYRACSLALAAIPPANGSTMPYLKGIALTQLIADNATTAFHDHLQNRMGLTE